MNEIMQAVNELMGDLGNSPMHCSTDRFLYSAVNSHYRYITFFGGRHSNMYQRICTVEEFNNLVAELSAAEWIK